MNWKLKCVASHILAKLPYSDDVYDMVQKHLTGRWTRNVEKYLDGPNPYLEHLEAFEAHYGDVTEATYFEFGVARDLFSNLLNYCCGLSSQIGVGLRPLARPELVNHAIEGLQKIRREEFTRVPDRLVGEDFLEELKDWYGIDYRAPCDASKTDLPDGSIDLVASTSTLEHIPPDSIREILTECRRLCTERSVLSMEIDYSDHYSHRDKSITPYNFLRFPESKWRHINMPHYYVNRLRHGDHRKLFEEAGFRVISERAVVPPDAEEMLDSIELAEKYRDHPREDLLKTRGVFVLKLA